MRTFFLAAIGVLISLSPAISQNVSKAEKVIYELSESGMLESYHRYRRETETQAALFKVHMSEHSAEDWVRMKAAYDETAAAFEKFVFEVRNDLLDGKKRRKIHKDTEGYMREHLVRLDQVYQEYYLGKFYPLYAEISGIDAPTAASQRTDGPIWAALITPITLATTKIVDFVEDRNEKKVDEFKETLAKEWVEPNRFRRWDEL